MRKLKNVYHWFRSWFWVLYYGYPARKLTVIGVTGTDGKTTTTTLIYEILRAAGYKAGMVTTVCAKINDGVLDVGLHVTNPEARVLQELLRRMVDLGCTHAVLEVTSHGLDQNRVVGCNFSVGVLTNITHEHLDYHGSMEEYISAKARLFRHVPFAVLNRDDPSFENLKFKIFNLNSNFKFQIVNYSKTKYGKISPSLGGEYNKYNIGAAAAVAQILKIQETITKQVVKNFGGVPGRREEIQNKLGIRCIVDFAHTPNALSSLLTSLRQETEGKLILVFGCTGERDKDKRPVMGEIADRLADMVIVTTDDVRNESQDVIYEQVASGMKRKPMREDDRDRAIGMGVKMAKRGDIVVAAGMGHEQTQLIGKTEIKRSDRNAFEKAILQRDFS